MMSSGRLPKQIVLWVDMVTEGEQRFMAAWKKKQVDVALHRQENRERQRDLKNLG